MGLFRPYTRDDSKPSPRDDSKPSISKASDLVGPHGGRRPVAARRPAATTTHPASAPVSAPTTRPLARQPVRKEGPTPSRKVAERTRMERLHPTLTAKEQKALERQAARERRLAGMSAVEGAPERVLLRDYIDDAWHPGEFLMPLMIILLAATFAAQYYPPLITWLSLVMWAVLLVVVVDIILTWVRFKRVLRQRLPQASSKGLLLYAVNRLIQIRRFRMPAPRIKRGAGY